MTRQIIFIAFIGFFSTLAAEAQVKQNHDLVKDGQPLGGMSVREQKADVNTNRPSYKRVQSTEIPPVLESTLTDKEFEGWRNGEVFYDEEKKTYDVRIDSVRSYQFNDEGTRLSPLPTPSMQDTTVISDSPVR